MPEDALKSPSSVPSPTSAAGAAAAATTPTNKWAERLRGRSRMAVAAIGGVLLVGFVGVSRPLSQRIDSANDRLTKAETRMILAGDVHSLRKQASLYSKKLPRGVDTNEWTNFFLTIFRAERVKLVRMDPKDIKPLGPCKVLSWQIDLVGDFTSLSRIVEKLESGERVIRIDRLVMENTGSQVSLSMLVKGLALDVPLDRKKASISGSARDAGQAEPDVEALIRNMAREVAR